MTRQRGLSLVELMVALAIGVFLIAGVISVFGKTSNLYRANETAARMQETARYAMSTLDTDLRMANYWGLNNRADLIQDAPGLDPANLPAPDPGYTLPASLNLTGYAAAINACGAFWAIKLAAYVEGTNGGYGLGCAEFDGAGRAVAGADQLTVRRASAAIMTPAQLAASAGEIKVQTSRVLGTMFADTSVPAGFDPSLSETHALQVSGYYVDRDSDESVGRPSLRRKILSVSGGVPAIEDQEVAPDIEDMQVEMGVDQNGDQNADFYVPLGTALAADDAVVAIRVWLMVRSERPEPGFTDNRTYSYADRTGAAAYTPGDGYRRLLVTRTISLRNTRR